MNDLAELERELGARLRATLDLMLVDDATEPFHDDTPLLGKDPVVVPIAARSTSGPSRPVARALVFAAAALALVGTGAVYVASARQRPPVENSSVVTEPADDSLPVLEVLPTNVPVSTAPPDTIVDEPASSGIWLPSSDVPGFSIADLSVTRGLNRFASRTVGTVRYDRRGADGQIDASLFLRFDDAQGSIGSTNGRTIHGQAAMVYDSGEGTIASWVENGFVFEARGVGVDEDAVVALAEALVIHGTPAAFDVPPAPAGFEQSPGGGPDASDALWVQMHWLPDVQQAGVDISFSAAPNIDGTTADQIEFDIGQQPTYDIEPTTVHGQPAILATSTLGPYSPLRNVSWLENGTFLSMTGRIPAEQLLALAEGLTPATLDDARAIRQQIDERQLQLAELDRSTLPNRFQVSVRTTGTGANAMCVEAPELTCETNTSEGSLVGDDQAVAVLTFLIDGKPWLIGWAEGTHQPHVVAQGEATDPVDQTVQGAAGTFFALPFADASTQVVLDPGDQTMYGGADLGTVEALI